VTEVDNVVKGTVEHCQTIVETDHDNHPLEKQKQIHFLRKYILIIHVHRAK
jgi:hypothetical protein